ncbi:carbon-nitrogen hydrolase family protein [candidate division KSB1 bacterium]
MFRFLILNMSVIFLLVSLKSTISEAQMKEEKRIIKVAAVQMDAVKYDKEANFKKAESMLRKAAAQGADIACLPECALTGYPRLNRKRLKTEEEYQKELKKIISIAEPIPGPYSKKFTQLARELGMYIITGYEELRDGKVYNTCILLSPKGEIVGRYSKMHLQDWMVDSGINHGSNSGVFDISVRGTEIKVGIIICYDIQVPESARLAMVERADILFVPYCTSDFSKEIHRWLFRIRALENQFYLLRVNFASPYINGDSMLIDPRGNVIFGSQTREGVFVGEVDLDYLDKTRKTYKIYGPTYRMPEAYEKIIK